MPIKFGWCMDGYCTDCRVHYRDWYEPEKIHECSCECHVGKKKPPLPEPHERPKEEKASRRRTKKS